MSIQQRNLSGSQEIYRKISKFIPEAEWKIHAPIIEKINKLKNKLRRRLLPISSDKKLSIGDELTFNDEKIGKIVIDQPYTFGLIQIRDPDLKEFKDKTLLANKKECKILKSVK